MFNNSGVFGRNDPVTRKETQPPVLSSLSERNNPSARPASGPRSNGQTSSSNASAAPEKAAEPPQPVAASAPAGEVGDGDKVIGARLIVGPDVKLKGAEILDCDTLVVEGRVEATMDSRVIRIAEKGAFSGKVSIDIAEVYGTFEGELTARSQLIIHATGRVSGSIRFGKLVVDEGGELCGEINVLTETATPAAKPRAVLEPVAPRSVVSA